MGADERAGGGEMKVGFIGLGLMGKAMAARLLDAGHELAVHNRTPAAAEPLRARGARVAAAPRDALDAEVVVTMLADDAAVREVWLAPDLVARMPAGAVHLNMATVGLGVARELAARHARGGSAYVSAPVFGRPPAAARGELDVIAAGPELAIARCGPLFDAMARKTFVVGTEAEKANAVKIARNFLLATVVEGLGEALALAERSGVAPDAFLDILTSTSLGAPAYRNYGQLMVERAYVPAQFSLRLGLKDVELALATAREAGLALPSGELIRGHIESAIAAGDGEKDWAVLAEHAARRAS
jgi:3-hydroxyisobutyrate dehydrogenase-like beta-hydroxyacid dehydrogenase